MILFSTVDVDSEYAAYKWHKASTEHDKSVYPRSSSEFNSFVINGMAWSAIDEYGAYQGLAYASYTPAHWEVGGLAVSVEAREKGVGLLLAYLVLGHLLFEEDPLDNDPPRPIRVIVHVLKSNAKPLPIIERLRFRTSGPVTIHGSQLPGLPTEEDGYVHGKEYELTVPDTLMVLREWAVGWEGRLRNGEPALIVLREGVSIAMWAEAFAQMAERNGHS
ncbi:MAG: hypothetical protein H7062_08245 [Candidatus Saccharimonas sp.]|nr:hypothetical protein [Planctomycetaceae bacterium]